MISILQFRGSDRVAPAMIINTRAKIFTNVKILFKNDDSLTPIINKPVIIIVRINAKKSTYEANSGTFIGVRGAKKFLIRSPARAFI